MYIYLHNITLKFGQSTLGHWASVYCLIKEFVEYIYFCHQSIHQTLKAGCNEYSGGKNNKMLESCTHLVEAHTFTNKLNYKFSIFINVIYNVFLKILHIFLQLYFYILL